MEKIGNTSFNEKAIKDMTFIKFDATYRDLLKGATTAEAYDQLTGKKPSVQDIGKAKESAEKVDIAKAKAEDKATPSEN